MLERISERNSCFVDGDHGDRTMAILSFNNPFLSVLWLSLSPQHSSSPPEKIIEHLRLFNLQLHPFPETGRGIRTTRDRNENELVLAIGAEQVVTSASILAKYPRINDAAKAGSQVLTDEQVLSLGICHLRHDHDEYASSLPDQYSVLTMPEHLKSCVPLTYAKVIDATQEYAVDMYESSCDALRAADEDTALYIPSLVEFLWAFATVRSRSVGVDFEHTLGDRIRPGGGGQFRAMIPGFDLLNHRVGTKSTLQLQGTDQWELRSICSYQAGDQVFISYGDDRDNLKLMLTYNFCIAENPEMLVFFDVDDLLQGCASARPTLFHPLTVAQLKQLVTRVGGEEMSRTLLAYDGRTRLPTSILNAHLGMVTQICEQLGGASAAEHFPQETLACMLQTRAREINTCLERLDVALTQVGHEWNGMGDAIRLLLTEEEEAIHNYLGLVSNCKYES